MLRIFFLHCLYDRDARTHTHVVVPCHSALFNANTEKEQLFLAEAGSWPADYIPCPKARAAFGSESRSLSRGRCRSGSGLAMTHHVISRRDVASSRRIPFTIEKCFSLLVLSCCVPAIASSCQVCFSSFSPCLQLCFDRLFSSGFRYEGW